MNNILIAESSFLTLTLLLILCPIAKKVGLTDQPCSRKQHQGEIPLIGGLSIFLALSLLLLYWAPSQSYAFIAASSLIVIFGVIDDYKTISFKLRILIEMIAALIMIEWGGMELTSLGNLFGFGEIQLGQYSVIFTLFAVVGGINAFNMIDGIDGLAGSIALITFALIFAVNPSSSQISTLCIIFIPAIMIFLVFNMRILGRKKASIFLGDTGSMLFGFSISYLIIVSSQGSSPSVAPVTVLWIIGLPLFDTVSIMIRRMRKGKSPFAPDREHFHHILPLAGYSINQTVSILVLLSLSLGCFGIIGEKVLQIPEWIMFSIFLILFVAHYWGMSHAWKMMKLARYLRESHKDRRKQDRRKHNILPAGMEERRGPTQRRQGIDRRYHDFERILHTTKHQASKKDELILEESDLHQKNT